MSERALDSAGRKTLVFYDGRCALCTRSQRLLRRLDRRGRRLGFVDIHDAPAMAEFPMITPEAAEGGIHVLTPDGRLAAGYDGLALIAERMPLRRLLVPLLRLGLMRRLGRRVYGWIARNRFRLMGRAGCSGDCGV